MNFLGAEVVADERVVPGVAWLMAPLRLVDARSVESGGVVVTTFTYEQPPQVAIVNLATEPKPQSLPGTASKL